MDECSILGEENTWIESAPTLQKPLGETVLTIKNLNKCKFFKQKNKLRDNYFFFIFLVCIIFKKKKIKVKNRN